MPDFINLLPTLNTENINMIIKTAVLVAIALYGVFAFIVVRQVDLMNRSFETPLGAFFKLIAFLHLIAVVVIFLLSFALL